MVRRSVGYAAVAVFLLSTFSGFSGATASVRSRLNDKDMGRLMENLSDDAQPFRRSFASALKKSTIRGTSREKEARELANTFADQSKRAHENFKHKRKAAEQVAAMVDTAGLIDPLVYRLHLNPEVTAQWEKLRTELHQVAQRFGVQEPYYQAQPGKGSGSSVPGGSSPGDYRSCVISAGPRRSQGLVRECLQVSPATHPPCNVQNACSLIVEEIRRGCAMLGPDAPSFCAEYR